MESLEPHTLSSLGLGQSGRFRAAGDMEDDPRFESMLASIGETGTGHQVVANDGAFGHFIGIAKQL